MLKPSGAWLVVSVEARVACRRRAMREHEVGRAERAAAQVDELRDGVAGVAYARVAAQRLDFLRQRDRVELHHVRAGFESLEVVLAFVVGDGVAAVFEIDADAGHAFAEIHRRVARAGEHAPQQQRRALEQLLAQQHGDARGVRLGAVVGARRDAVDERAAGRAGRDDGDVAQRQALARRELTHAERERAARRG